MATVPGVGYHAKHATRAWQAVLDLFDETFQASSVRAESSTVGRPNRAEFSDHYAPFIALVPDHDIRDLLRAAGARRDATVVGITESAASIEPPAGKWNIRETLAHLADMERVMAYRALRIARGDRTPVSGVDQNLYAVNSYANERSIADLRSELRAVRASTVALFGSFPSTVWQWMDVVEGDPVSLRALAYIIVGHDLHHLQQLADRFGVAVRQNVNDSQLTSAAAEQT